MQKRLVIKFFNVTLLFSIFSFLMYKFRYAIVINDDLVDLIAGQYNFYHGRYLTEFISILFIKLIPKYFNINIQNFAIVSEGLVKSLFFIFLLFILKKTFTKNCKISTLFEIILYPLSFFMIFSMLFQLDYINVFDTMQTFMGYIFPFIFFILFWLKLYDVYSVNKKSELSCGWNNKNLILLILYTIIVTMGNEELNFAALILLLFLLFNKSMSRKYVICSLIAMFITGFWVYYSSGFLKLYNDAYHIHINFDLSLNNIYKYLEMFIKFIIADNIFLWIPYVSFIIFLKADKTNINKQKIIKYSFYSVTSFLIFFLSLYLLGKSYGYMIDNNFKLYEPYWILYPALLIGLKIILYTNILYLLGNILTPDVKIYKEYILYFIFLISCLFFIFQNYKNIELSDKNSKTVMYMTDKIAVEYFKQGKTAILPKDDIEIIIPVINDLMPYDLLTENYKGKIYYKEQYPYLWYIRIVYNVNTNYGMMFKPSEQAMEDFYKIGGDFTKKELDVLDFSKLNVN